jgi:hypothetical protein
MSRAKPNKRGAGKGGLAVLWHAERVWPALPDRERSAMITRACVALFALAVLGGGCTRSPSSTPPTAATVTTVSLFDSDEASHPAPRDSRWTITNHLVIARISEVLRSDADGPRPACPAVGSIELVDVSGVTNRFFILHIHTASLILLDRSGGSGGEFIVRNGDELLRGLGACGVPTNKLFAASVKD